MEDLTMAARPKASSGTARSPFGKRLWAQRYLMILTLPAVIWLIIFHYVPMYGIIIAFEEYNPVQGFTFSPWVGLVNFKELFIDPSFLDSVANTFKISFLKLLFGFPAPILLAIMLNELRAQRLKKVVQSLSYLPYFISWVFVVGFMYTLLDPRTGALSGLLQWLGLITQDQLLMGDPKTFTTLVVVSEVWKNIGWNSIIFLAAIASIDPQLYEAATVDGAGRFRKIWHVTLPAIKPTVVILLILNVGGLVNANFDQLFLMKNSMTQDQANVLSIYSYEMGLVLGRFSYGTAVGLFQSVVAFLLMLGANYSSRKMTKESLF
ncbi:putative aldouronate transport system permease protein [Paenibacillus endophyticus]|uniref:Putative aldouronate transport system permease protein n=1 Tax=Paenibacillus endophyticus TaxID=1294268 RepID=A0A7W5CAZ3_9BACL|nr:ABC transporter permease subunit [Paenibacillus endophyticus]MBB3153945.1 putative aldouronate transport system permease protein [Paenibacillus endophyticus]